MGEIIFQSRQSHKEFDIPHHILEPGIGDDLPSYRPGDSVEIFYHVPKSFIGQFESRNGPGFRCYLSPGLEPTETPRYQAVIEYTVVRVKHSLMKEGKDVYIFSEMMHSIIVKADSDAGEEALIWILENLKPNWLKQIEAQNREASPDLPPE